MSFVSQLSIQRNYPLPIQPGQHAYILSRQDAVRPTGVVLFRDGDDGSVHHPMNRAKERRCRF